MDSHDKYKSTLSFLDLLFNILLGFVLLFFIAFILINPIAKKADIVIKAEYMITMSWPDNSSDDIDLWVKDPNGNYVSFRNRDVGFMNLDRDDLGLRNDTVTINGQETSVPINKETVTIRGIIPGTYLISAHFYYKVDQHIIEVPVTVEVIKINPYKIIYTQTVILTEHGQEKNYYKFTISTDGSVTDIGTSLESAVNRNTVL